MTAPTKEVPAATPWQEIKVGDLVRWVGNGTSCWEQVKTIQRTIPGVEYSPEYEGVAATFCTDLGNAITCKKDSSFVVRRRVEHQYVYGVHLELFDDGSVRVDGEPKEDKPR